MQDNSVSIVTSYGLDGRYSIPEWTTQIRLLATESKLALGISPASYPNGYGGGGV